MSFQEFQKSSRKISPQEVRFLLAAFFVLIALGALLSFINLYLAETLADGGEFYLLRIASRSFLFDRIEPYSASVPALVQEQVYGRPAQPGEELYILDAPFFLMPVFFPLALFPEHLSARASWMAFEEAALAAFLILSFRLFERKPSRIFTILTIVLSFFSYYSWQSFLEGSIVILLGVVCIGILLALRAQMDELAGALLVFLFFHWEICAPFLIYIFLSVIWAKRWAVFRGAGMLFITLMIVSLLLYPDWILPFLRASWNNFNGDFWLSTGKIVENISPDHGGLIRWILTGLLMLLLGYEWAASRGASFERIIWVAGLTIAVTPLLGFRSELDNLVVLTFPFIQFLVIMNYRWKRIGGWLAFVLQILFFSLPWLWYLEILPPSGMQIQEILFLFLPIVTFLGLYWMRWWVTHPPLTWLDEVTYRGQR